MREQFPPAADRTPVVPVLAEPQDCSIGPLVAKAKQGDLAAFEEIYARYEVGVRELCARTLGSQDAGRDATQEVFTRVRQRLDLYDAKRPFRPWLMTVAANFCRDVLRRGATERRVLDRHQTELDHLGQPSIPSPLTRLETDEQAHDLRAAIDALPEPLGAALRLRYFEDRSYDEIAERLGADRNQVATWLFRARKQLRARLAPNMQPSGAQPS